MVSNDNSTNNININVKIYKLKKTIKNMCHFNNETHHKLKTTPFSSQQARAGVNNPPFSFIMYTFVIIIVQIQNHDQRERKFEKTNPIQFN